MHCTESIKYAPVCYLTRAAGMMIALKDQNQSFKSRKIKDRSIEERGSIPSGMGSGIEGWGIPESHQSHHDIQITSPPPYVIIKVAYTAHRTFISCYCRPFLKLGRCFCCIFVLMKKVEINKVEEGGKMIP